MKEATRVPVPLTSISALSFPKTTTCAGPNKTQRDILYVVKDKASQELMKQKNEVKKDKNVSQQKEHCETR